MSYYIPDENKEEIYKIKNLLDRFVYGTEFSDFISPFAQNYLLNVLKKDYPNFIFNLFGGHEECERKILCITDTDQPTKYPIDIILIESKKVLNHRQILGTIIGSGIKRNKLGDIFVKENEAILFVKEDISDYISANVRKIGRDYVCMSKVDFDRSKINEFIVKESKKLVCTVSSLRLDAILSHGFGISRDEANQLVKQLKVLVNWVYIEKPSHEIKQGDLISARHYGRLKVEKVLSVTKKGRITIELSKYS